MIGVNIWLFLRDYPHDLGYTDHVAHAGRAPAVTRRALLTGIVQVFKYPNTLLLCLIPGSLVGSVLTFAGLWGVPYLATHHGLSTPKAAAMTSAHLIAWAVAGPLFGWFSDRLGVRKPLFIIGCALSFLGWSALVFIHPLPLYGLIALLLVTGFSSGCMIISFAFAKESVPEHLGGTISGVINMGIMKGTMILQPAVGWILDNKWQGRMAEGVRLYGLEAYQTGFSLMIVWTALALVLLFFTRETYCRPLR